MESCELNISIFRCLKLRKLEMKNLIFNGIKQFFIRIVGCCTFILDYLDVFLFSEIGWIKCPLKWWLVTCPLFVLLLYRPVFYLMDLYIQLLKILVS